MERLALIGVSHRRGGAGALEAWQAAFGADAAAAAACGLPRAVPLVTCNRWDLVLELPEGVPVEEARRRLTPPGAAGRPYAYVGDAALEQLTRIAASLDSLNPGEDQIMKQVREAYRAARERGEAGPLLHYAFETALRIAKAVRREIALAPLNTSLFSLARPELEALLRPGDAVAVLGAGEMGALAATALAELDGVRLLVANRSPERARRVARRLGGEARGLADFLAAPEPVRALVCATPVAGLLDAAALARLAGLELIVDLGVPRNVDRPAARAAGVRVLDVDALQAAGAQRREALGERLAQAERLVQRELDAALEAWTERQLGPSIRRLIAMYRDTLGSALPEAEATRLARKVAHVPILGLRAVAREHGLEAARTFLAETGLESVEGGER